MSVFNELKNKISKSSQDTVKKAKSIANIAKINSQIAEEQRTLTAFYSQIGEKYYELYKNAPAEEFSQYCDRITAGLMRIAELRTEVQRLKNTKFCPKCGAACPVNVQFCSTCGAQLPQIDPATAVANDGADSSNISEAVSDAAAGAAVSDAAGGVVSDAAVEPAAEPADEPTTGLAAEPAAEPAAAEPASDAANAAGEATSGDAAT